MENKTLNLDDIEEFVNTHEETIIRLHFYLRKMEKKYDDFKSLKKKLSRKRPILNRKDKEEFVEFTKYTFQQGKFYGYMFDLRNLGETELVDVIWRLRGMKFITKGEIIETKHFRW